MPITRKQQVLAKVETTEGGGATFAGSDAIQVFDPALSDDADVQDRAPAGPTLSRDFTPVGRKSRQLTFKSDFRGSGSTGTAPDFAKLLQASAFKASVLKSLVTAAVTGTGFQVGEQVYQGASYAAATAVGVIVGIFTAGGALLSRTVTTGQTMVVAVISGTFAGSTATVGASSASTSTIGASVTNYAGFGYQPTSLKLINVATGSWTGTAPAAVGEVLKIEQPSGTVIGHCQVIVDNGTMTNMDVVLLSGSLADTYTLRSAGNGTAAISGAPTMVATPSLAIRHNLDGRQRDQHGARGDWSLDGEAGTPMQFSWTFQGDVGNAADALPVATSGLSTVRPPRLLGSICVYGLGAVMLALPTKKVGASAGNTVTPNLDANRAGGATGSNVTDRDPTVTTQVDVTQSGFDWESARDNGTVVRAAFILGSTAGNIVCLVVPAGQVTVAAAADAEGVAAWDITIKPRRIRESGDDEMFICQL